MYFKCLDSEGHWHWIADVIDIAKLDGINVSNQKPELIGKKSKTNPHIISLTTAHGPRLLELYGTKAYLCNDDTGATLDTVI